MSPTLKFHKKDNIIIEIVHITMNELVWMGSEKLFLKCVFEISAGILKSVEMIMHYVQHAPLIEECDNPLNPPSPPPV